MKRKGGIGTTGAFLHDLLSRDSSPSRKQLGNRGSQPNNQFLLARKACSFMENFYIRLRRKNVCIELDIKFGVDKG